KPCPGATILSRPSPSSAAYPFHASISCFCHKHHVRCHDVSLLDLGAGILALGFRSTTLVALFHFRHPDLRRGPHEILRDRNCAAAGCLHLRSRSTARHESGVSVDPAGGPFEL